jgi:hypothetical protein
LRNFETLEKFSPSESILAKETMVDDCIFWGAIAWDGFHEISFGNN